MRPKALTNDMANSLLQQLRSVVTVDIDCMDPEVAKRHSTEEKFQNMTSNQAIALVEIVRPENVGLVKQAIKSVQDKNLNQDPDTFKMDVIDTLMVLLAKRIFPYLKGDVLVQISPPAARDTEKTIAHAKKLVALFAEHGIPKERVCIKIPATPEAMLACQYLSKIGIQTLGTCLFSLSQALAASQAGCKYISPYFNELRVHLDKSLWKELADPALEHPMSAIILSIVASFRATESRTLVMPASVVTPNEVIALARLQPDHLTIVGHILDQLAALPAIDEITPVPLPKVDAAALKGMDYLANGASLLREAINTDSELERKLTDALVIFGDSEKDIKKFLDTVAL